MLFTVIYVAPFYVSKTTRPSQTLHRDAPSVIRARIRAVTTSCIICTMITLYILAQSAHDSLLDALHHLGWWPISIADIIKVLLLLCVLFAGPLFENGIVDGDWRDWIVGRHVNETFSSWIGWRNFVAVSVSTILKNPGLSKLNSECGDPTMKEIVTALPKKKTLQRELTIPSHPRRARPPKS